MALFRKRERDQRNVLESPQYGWIWKPLIALLVIYLVVCVALGVWWSQRPDAFNVDDAVSLQRGAAQSSGAEAVTDASRPGETVLATTVTLLGSLLDKPGGYLRNDIAPPGLWLDNMPSWEQGVLGQVRAMSAALNGAITDGTNDTLQHAVDALETHSDAWRFPSAEGRYQAAREALRDYLGRLREQQASFSQEAPALAAWLGRVQTRLERQTQRLAASVGHAERRSADIERGEDGVNTPWWRIDNVFFEARGNTWALKHLLDAARRDFAPAIEAAGVGTAFDQLIAELDASQAPLWSPIVLNGSGFGIFANHSLMMANYTLQASQLIARIRSDLEASSSTSDTPEPDTPRRGSDAG
ncbi:hypothetical protein C8E00_103433 [Chromohalobacter marismortui]|uniref:DUF2333 family protein n=1 Tax=Chromohalobacter marismortui TaxID=42055 RepID=A0A4R7NRL8_9GAMM|nr:MULTISPECIES: DUF2333 family protein [Chromohalobacter]MCI0508580.1 DUF2333 family protein [Chromohalobacter sp.]MCI0594364.1 DUF2333 family protein [Chromohalobacter sp.]TDU23060.1 hypothetical protein C8E00_103433 [Chromohalobacter marismortui]